MLRAGLSLFLAIWFLFASGPAPAQTVPASDADWPAWRHDAAHTGSTSRPLAERLYLHWTLELPPLRPGWPDQPRVQLDALYEPIVVGQRLYIPSARNDGVSAVDTRSGETKWTYFTDGPVRYSPVAWDNKLYFSSDDGFLYCLDAAQGALLWKFRGGPNDRRVLGNERLISTWPARGAPVIADGVVYFAAGIWPFMGIFIHALDAKTGAVVWTNEGDGSIYMQQPHNVDSFAGIAPQGPMVVVGDRLLVTGGRSVPACYDRKTGKLVYFKFADNGRRGGVDVASAGGLFFAGGQAYDLSNGAYAGEYSRPLALGPDLVCYTGKKKDLLVARLPTMTMTESVDRKGVRVMKPRWKLPGPETLEHPAISCLLRAGNRVYAGSEGRLTAVQITSKPKEVWRLPVAGTPGSLIAADDRLFVVTSEGLLHCYGPEEQPPVVRAWKVTPLEEPAAELPYAVADGYALRIGAADPAALAQFAHGPKVRAIAIDSDADRVDRARRSLVAAGLYGDRIAVHVGDASVALPPYLAGTIVCDAGPIRAQTVRRLYDSLRPYGGRLHILKKLVSREELDAWISDGSLAAAAIEEADAHYILIRAGALPGAGSWTHEHADAANTRVSKDSRARAPLGLLWFGGPSHEGILPRHGHGPQPQVLDGRLLIEGVDMLRATDIYTGRLLWETSLPGVGDFYNNVLHQPGANASGSNLVTTSDGIYVAWKNKCVRLDPETGRILAEFAVPGGGPTDDWSFLTVAGDFLVGGSEPIGERAVPKQTTGGFDDPQAQLDAAMKKLLSVKVDNDGRSSSRRLFVMDRKTGQVLWQAAARSGFRHNSLCASADTLFIIDRLSGLHLSRLKKKGEMDNTPAVLLAFELKTGLVRWRSEDGIFGTFLSYSAAHDVLIECGRVARDTVSDEPKDMRAWRAADGKPLWKKNYSGPGMIHGDTILLGEAKACDLMTGAPRGRIHPITGLTVEWTWARNYGCNTPAASEHLLTFRSGAAGYFDLAGDGGTGNLGGFKSGCTNNLIVAGGLLNAPDYTRTCICSYQNQASLALVPMPEAEMWTFFGNAEVKGPVKRLGINLGAPGDRRADDGTLWIEHPSVGGKSPAAPLALDGKIDYFRKHSSRMTGDGLPWVCASGAKGISTLTLTIDKDAKQEQPYTVRLLFSEPDGLKPGERVFDVALQGGEVLKDFDIVREAGGPDRGVVKEFTVPAGKELKVAFKSKKAQPLLCGLEIFAGGEVPPTVNVVNSTLTVPEPPPMARAPASDEDAGGDDLGMRALLWIGLGSVIFMYLFYRMALLRRRAT